MVSRRKMLSWSLGAVAAPAVVASACASDETEAADAVAGTCFPDVDRKFPLAYVGYAWGEPIGNWFPSAGPFDNAIEKIGRFGYQGIEPFPRNIQPELYRANPLELKARMDDAGLSLATLGGTLGSGGSLIDPAGVPEAVENHEATCRDFLQHFDCKHFKFNIGGRPEGGPSDAQLGTLADALNEIGRRTLEYGIRAAPHPHIWSPFERPEEIALVLERTDPELVWLTLDTAHFQLGGTDPLRFAEENFSRIAAVHFKDTPYKYRGYTGPTPTREEHQESPLYRAFGEGGCDFPGFSRLMLERGFDGWVSMDFDPPRPHEGTLEQQMEHNTWYLTDVLGYNMSHV